ncbi:MAG: hypothetical protein O3B09_02380, partial [Proteobacteria bacterium]|nr:hypothetical protein [Pseudomonadota bacterium]
MTNPINQNSLDIKTRQALAKILNVSEEQIIKNADLFSNINPFIERSLHYLSLMKSDNVLIHASHSMECLLTFSDRIVENDNSQNHSQ